MSLEKSLSRKNSMKFRVWSGAAALSRVLLELLVFWIWYLSLTENVITPCQAMLMLGFFWLVNQIFTTSINLFENIRIAMRILFPVWIISFLFFSVKSVFFAHEDINALQLLLESFKSLANDYSLAIFWHCLLLLFLALRSVSFARTMNSNYGVKNSFRIGFILFCVHAWLFGRFSPNFLFPAFFIFMLLGLISLSTSKIADLGELRDAKLPGFNRQWGYGIMLACCSGVVLTILASLIFSLPVSEFMGKVSVIVLQLIVGAIILISSPVLVGLVFLLEKFVKLIMPTITNMAETMELNLDMEFTEEVVESLENSSNVDPQSILLGSMLLGLFILIIILLRWKPWQRNFAGEEETEMIDSRPPQINPFRNMIDNLRTIIKPSGAGKLMAAAQIRRIYANLMEMCKKLGKPRPRASTPLEFLPKAEALFPDYSSDLQTITNAYLRVRYGELPENFQEVEIVKKAWENIKKHGNSLLDEKKKENRRRK